MESGVMSVGNLCLNGVVLKRHLHKLHNDNYMDIYPDINIMLHGVW